MPIRAKQQHEVDLGLHYWGKMLTGTKMIECCLFDVICLSRKLNNYTSTCCDYVSCNQCTKGCFLDVIC